MTCTKCKHNREIARLAEEQARLREICSKCRLGEDLAGGGGVSLDVIHDGTVDRVAKVAPNHPTSYTYDPGEIDEPQQYPDTKTRTRDALHTLLACFSAIDYKTFSKLFNAIFTVKNGKIEIFSQEEFEIVAHFMDGGTMISYAEAHDLTKQTAFARIKNLFKKRPIFEHIANGGLLHGKGGRQAEEPDEDEPRLTQGDLFDL